MSIDYKKLFDLIKADDQPGVYEEADRLIDKHRDDIATWHSDRSVAALAYLKERIEYLDDGVNTLDLRTTDAGCALAAFNDDEYKKTYFNFTYLDGDDAPQRHDVINSKSSFIDLVDAPLNDIANFQTTFIDGFSGGNVVLDSSVGVIRDVNAQPDGDLALFLSNQYEMPPAEIAAMLNSEINAGPYADGSPDRMEIATQVAGILNSIGGLGLSGADVADALKEGLKLANEEVAEVLYSGSGCDLSASSVVKALKEGLELDANEIAGILYYDERGLGMSADMVAYALYEAVRDPTHDDAAGCNVDAITETLRALSENDGLGMEIEEAVKVLNESGISMSAIEQGLTADPNLGGMGYSEKEAREIMSTAFPEPRRPRPRPRDNGLEL